MKIKRTLLICIAFLILLGITTGDLTCWIEDSQTCSIGTELLRMKNDTDGYDNAHAQQVNYTTPYSHTLCCNSTNVVLGNSSGTTFLNLSADTGAHVQAPNGTSAVYFIPAYISAGPTNPVCDTYISGCAPGYTCLLSIGSDGNDNTTNAHVSSCNVYDTDICCNSTSVNSPPNNVSGEYFLEPFNGNATLFNLTVSFQWLNTTDPDGDALTYQIQVDEIESEFQSPVIDASGITEGTNITEYISTAELATDQNYTWRVRAYDGTDYGGWGENWTFYIPSTVILTLFDTEMSFGEMKPDEVNDTTDNDPYPFRLRNDGNVLTDINITVDTADDWLWDGYQLASQYFQYSIDNATAYKTYKEENNSFNWSDSATTPGWFDLPLTNASANIRQLNYSDATDEAEIDMRIQVPSDESAGAKGSGVRVTGWASL